MLKMNEIIANTKYYNLHSGNHNANGNPHPQYITGNTSTITSDARIQANNLVIYCNFSEVTTVGGEGTITDVNKGNFNSWCVCVGANVELVDNSSEHIQLYYTNVWCNTSDVIVRVKNPTTTEGSKVKVRYILIGE